MQNTNILQHGSQLSWMLKIAGAAYNAPATFVLFLGTHSFISQDWIKYGFAFIAVILIDLFLLACMAALESDVDPRTQRPVAFTGLILIFAILLIGYISEGVAGIAPRLVLVLLMLQSEFVWLDRYVVQYRSYEHRMEREHKRRELEDLKYRNHQITKRREAEEAAFNSAIKQVKKQLVEKHRRSELKRIGEMETEEPKSAGWTEIKPGLFSNGKIFGIQVDGKLRTRNSKGEYYTDEAGAKRALSRLGV